MASWKHKLKALVTSWCSNIPSNLFWHMPYMLLKYPYVILLRISAREGRLPALALIFPTLLSLYLTITHSKLYGSSSVTFVREFRASVQILVQILAEVLSVAQLYCLCSLFNYFSREKVERVALTLQKLSLWSALSNVKIDWSLPPRYLLLTILIAFLSMGPGALWAGALTPVVTRGWTLSASVDVPSYSASTANVWNSEFYLDEINQVWNRIENCFTVQDHRGLLPSCPVPSLQALLLLSASTATMMDGGPRLHTKLDNPEWTYVGRSYGVGSPIGLTSPAFGESTRLANGHYLESGYKAEVTCIKNASSDISLEYIGTFGADPVTHYVLQGRLPNEPPEVPPEYYPIPVFNSSFLQLAAWAARSWQGNNVLVIATELYGNMSILDKIQCKMIFTPTQFQVSVDLNSRTISATVVSSPFDDDLEPSGDLTSNVVQSLNLLSRMSPSLYISLVGNSLMTNMQNLKAQLNATESTDAIATKAVADSLTAVIDDILVAYGASQLTNANSSTPVKAFADAYGVRVGDLAYIIAVVVINLIITVVYLVESVRTNFWSDLSKFNYVDLKSMVLAASAGGFSVSDAFQDWRTRNSLNEWDGNGEDSAFGAIPIKVCRRRILSASAFDDAKDSEVKLEHDDHDDKSVKVACLKTQDGMETQHTVPTLVRDNGANRKPGV